eukprot:g1082.t1
MKRLQFRCTKMCDWETAGSLVVASGLLTIMSSETRKITPHHANGSSDTTPSGQKPTLLRRQSTVDNLLVALGIRSEDEKEVDVPVDITPIAHVLPEPDYTRFDFMGIHSKRQPFLPLPQRDLPLSFFRNMFAVLTQRFGDRRTGEIPSAHFERALRRVCTFIGEPKRKIDAADYDVDNSGAVGWWEFVSCWKDERFSIKLNIWERITLLFEDPSSCRLAKYVSMFLLLTILLSSTVFVIGTLPSMRRWLSDSCEDRCDVPNRTGVFTEAEKQYCERFCEPVPAVIFDALEIFCVVIFSVEYVIRIVASHGCRLEVLEFQGLHNMVLDESVKTVKRPLLRTWRFFISPMNLIDLMAVFPFYLEAIVNQLSDQGEGDGLSGSTVLRVVRLARLFRLLKVARYFQTLQVIVLVVQRAAAGLLVLFFVLLLCVIFSGSVLYYAEQGDWDSESNTYLRYNWVDNTNEITPFKSIPHSLWWSFVTYTTVGYGDMMPYSVVGQMLCIVSMLCSMLSVGMPTSVLLRCFNDVWEETTASQKEAKKQFDVEREAVENVYLYSEPWRQCRRVAIEVYDDTLSSARNDFLGQVTIELDAIGMPSSVQTKEEVLDWTAYTASLLRKSKVTGTGGAGVANGSKTNGVAAGTSRATGSQAPFDYEKWDDPWCVRATIPLKDNAIKVRSDPANFKVNGSITVEIEWIPDERANIVALEIPQCASQDAHEAAVDNSSAGRVEGRHWAEEAGEGDHGEAGAPENAGIATEEGGSAVKRPPEIATGSRFEKRGSGSSQYLVPTTPHGSAIRSPSLLSSAMLTPRPTGPKFSTTCLKMAPGRLRVKIVSVNGLKGRRQRLESSDEDEDDEANTVDPYVTVTVWNRPPNMSNGTDSEDDLFPTVGVRDEMLEMEEAFSTKLGDVSQTKRTRTCPGKEDPNFEYDMMFRYTWRSVENEKLDRDSHQGRDSHAERQMAEMYKKMKILDRKLTSLGRGSDTQ